MALRSSKSRRCPVCIACSPAKAEKVTLALSALLADVREYGEVPKPQDKRFEKVALDVELSPYSLWYHLKECMLDFEIQDQKLVELKDLARAIAMAKDEYTSNPSMQNSTAYTQLINAFMSMADNIEGSVDPEATVEFIVEAVMSPITRRALGALAEELRSLRESLLPLVAKNQTTFLDTQVKSTMGRVASQLRDATDESLKALCDYYKVELETKRRKRALDHVSTKPLDEDPEAVH